ncbi:MAG: hypothetical protein IT366_09615 [Candidatus Hydrogenedentes bacterium]|nr:hypothetical protein [Candidatus Hydrogenedentota bacterium]
MKHRSTIPFSILIIAAGSMLSSGCESRARSEPIRQEDSASSNALAADDVLEIARNAVAANDTWLDRTEFETPTKQADGSWSVMVWRLPKTPGGHRLIIVDAKGEVTDYVRGR